jgi:putative MFS transporter
VLPVALLIVGTNGIIAIVLPYTAESFPLKVRGRATGWVAAWTKGGGLLAQGLTISGVTLSMGASSLLVMLPTTIALMLVAWFGRETRGRDLRDLDADNGQIGHELA